MTQPSISISPNEPTAGDQMEVCYDFVQSTVDTVELRITFDLVPTGTHVVTVTVTKTDNCKKVNVPSDADSGTVEDLSQQAPDKGFAVKRPS
ncbi:MAG: hypothetical protein AAF196_08900 [Planctomycetota bacterium]